MVKSCDKIKLFDSEHRRNVELESFKKQQSYFATMHGSLKGRGPIKSKFAHSKPEEAQLMVRVRKPRKSSIH